MVVHQVALTFGDHSVDNESKNFGSLSFLFGQILVRVIGLYDNKSWINCCCCLTKNQNNPWITAFL
jgi:hypothetical protein